MNTVNLDAMLQTMLDTFVTTLTEQGAEVGADLRSHVEAELKAIVARLQVISKMLLAKQITASAAQTLLNMQKDTVVEHLLTVSGAAQVVLQNSLNAAINAVKDSLNTLLGVALA